MIYTFRNAELTLYEFEIFLNEIGIQIQTGSDLEKIAILILMANAIHKNEMEVNNSMDIREMFSDIMGLNLFMINILKNKNHKDFNQIIPHLHLLNNSETSVQTTKSKVTDSGNNKLFEIYIALLCMKFGKDIRLDNPYHSEGDNPDVMFSINDKRWAFACKALHSSNPKTIYNNLEKGISQINRSNADYGFVIINTKNIINTENHWSRPKSSTTNEDEALLKSYYLQQNLETFGINILTNLKESVGEMCLINLGISGKCPPGFLMFVPVVTYMPIGKHNVPMISNQLISIQSLKYNRNFRKVIDQLNGALKHKN